jgi:hypothetical protein
MKRVTFVALAALTATGCTATGGRSPEIVADLNKAFADCRATSKTHVARARYQNAAIDRYQRPYLRPRDQDLVNLLEAQRVAIAERVDAGTITQIEAEAEYAQDFAAANSESGRRTTNAQIAGAAMLATMPLTCTTFGATTNCY